MSRPPSWTVAALMQAWRPGSGDWDWAEEERQIHANWPNHLHALTEDISRRGVREPVLLGDDGRVWDGHHRLVAAASLDPSLRIPVEYGTTKEASLEVQTFTESDAAVLSAVSKVRVDSADDFDPFDFTGE